MSLVDSIKQLQREAAERGVIGSLIEKKLLPSGDKSDVEKSWLKKWEEMNEEERASLKEEQIKTGIAHRYNRGKSQWSLVDFQSFEPMVKVLEFGAKKYARDNWKKGLIPRQILESSLRHIFALLQGEENDQDSGLPHIGHLMCNDMFYSYFTQVHPEKAAKDNG